MIGHRFKALAELGLNGYFIGVGVVTRFGSARHLYWRQYETSPYECPMPDRTGSLGRHVNNQCSGHLGWYDLRKPDMHGHHLHTYFGSREWLLNNYWRYFEAGLF